MRSNAETTAAAVIIAIAVVTAAQSLIRAQQLSALANRPKPPPVPCVGEPIAIDEDYGGGPVKPWTCQVQCEDDQPRYITYRNGYATQCARPPECTDDGEDRGITCTLPLESSSE